MKAQSNMQPSIQFVIPELKHHYHNSDFYAKMTFRHSGNTNYWILSNCVLILCFADSTRDDLKILIFTLKLCPESFLRGIPCTIQKKVFTFIMMLVFSRSTVSFNNYSTLYRVHSIPLACFPIFML